MGRGSGAPRRIARRDEPMSSHPEPSTQEVLAGLVELVERVTYHNAENGFCVLRARARGHRDVVTVVGHAASISAGEWITASGDWVNDRTHGQQFKARFLRTSPPTSADGIEKYLSSGMIFGVGPVYAKKLVRAFGDDQRTQCRASEWLLIEWPKASPSRPILALDPCRRHSLRPASRPGQAALAHRARLSGAQAGGRPRAFRGRGWRGFHHHATLCIAAYGFLISERETISPSGPRSAWPSRNLPYPTIIDPEAPPLRPQRTSRTRSQPYASGYRRARHQSAAMPMLPISNRETLVSEKLVTQ